MNYEIRIERDIDPINPRTQFDNLGTMLCWHKQYHLGDEGHPYQETTKNCDSWDEVGEVIHEHEDICVLLPLYLYDHSGITISTRPFSCQWDSGQIGFIYVTKERVRSSYGVKRISGALRTIVEACLKAEVEEYDKYLRGDVWGYEIVNEDDEVVDSCWGFYDEAYCRKTAGEAFDWLKQNEEAA